MEKYEVKDVALSVLIHKSEQEEEVSNMLELQENKYNENTKPTMIYFDKLEDGEKECRRSQEMKDGVKIEPALILSNKLEGDDYEEVRRISQEKKFVVKVEPIVILPEEREEKEICDQEKMQEVKCNVKEEPNMIIPEKLHEVRLEPMTVQEVKYEVKKEPSEVEVEIEPSLISLKDSEEWEQIAYKTEQEIPASLLEHTKVENESSTVLTYQPESSCSEDKTGFLHCATVQSQNHETVHQETARGVKKCKYRDSETGFSCPNHLERCTHFYNDQQVCKQDLGGKSSTHSSLEKHLLNHNEKKLYTCETCGKSFRQSTNLKNHKLVHSGEKPFNCETCGIAFSRKGYLIYHQRLHSGEKPHGCEVCGKSFIPPSNLKAHKRIHSEERPFKCEVCDKTFTISSHLTSHLSIHDGIKSFMCDICGKTLSTSSNFKRHLNVHNEKKPYKCNVCGKSCSSSYHLTRHHSVHNKPSNYM